MLCLLLSVPSHAQQAPAAWVDPVIALERAVEQAEAGQGRQSAAYVSAVQRLTQAYLERGEAMQALKLFKLLLAEVEAALPEDAPQLVQARQSLAQFRELAEACGSASAADPASAASGERMRLVSQFAPYDGSRTAVSPDGRWLVNAAGRHLVVRDVQSGLVVRQLRNTPGQVSALSFAPDSTHVAVSFNNSCLGVWDVTTGEQSAMAGPPMGTGLQDFAVSPDGKLLAARYGGSFNGQEKKWLSVWNLQDGTLARRYFLDETRLPPPYASFQDVQPHLVFSPDGRSLLSYSAFLTRYWDLTQGRLAGLWQSADLLKQAGAGEQEFLQEIALSPAGGLMALRTNEAVWLRSPAEQPGIARRLAPSDSSVGEQLHFSPTGERLLVGTEKLYAVGSGEPLPFEDLPGVSWVGWLGSERVLASYVSGGDYQLVDKAGQLSYRPGRRPPGTSVVLFANDDSLLVTGPRLDSYWDLNSLYLHDQKPEQVRFGRPIPGGYVRAYNFVSQTGKPEDRPNAGVYVEDSRRMYTAHEDGRIRIWELASDKPTDKPLTTLKAHTGAITAIGVSGDERYLASASIPGSSRVIDVSKMDAEVVTLSVHERASAKQLWSSRVHTARIRSLLVTRDGQYLVAMSDTRITVHALATGELLRSIEPGDGQRRFGAIAVNPQGRLAFVLQYGWLDAPPRVVVQELLSGRELSAFENDAVVSGLALSDNGRLLATTQDGYASLWNLENGRKISLAEDYIRLPQEEQSLETIFDPPKEWVAYTPDGYFAAGRGGTGLVALVKGSDAYSLDQFGLRFNRPDILLERLNLGYPGVIEYFRHRYLTRAQRAGVQVTSDDVALAIPEARILSAGQPDAAGKVTLGLAFHATDVDLLSYNIAVNGVPVFGDSGKALSGRQAEVQARVQLSAGDNLLEISAVAANGMESVRQQMQLKGPEPTRKPALYFLGFGVSHYADAKLNLGFAHKDVLDLAKFLEASDQFDRVHVHSYTDAQVTPAAIRDAKAVLEKAGVDDLVVILVAGHGMHARTVDGTYYYLTHDADPVHLPDTAAPFATLESLLMDIPARNRLLLLDTCESGEKEPAFVTGVLDSLQGTQVRARTVRGLVLDEQPEQTVQPTDRRAYLQQRSRYIFSDTSRRNGIVMFASSAGHEFSYESAEKQNGYFTEALMQVLGEYGQTKSMETLRNKVRKLVVEYSDGKQHPEIYWNNPHAKLRFEPIHYLDLGSYQGMQ